jgi:hypothetical protein
MKVAMDNTHPSKCLNPTGVDLNHMFEVSPEPVTMYIHGVKLELLPIMAEETPSKDLIRPERLNPRNPRYAAA